MNPRKKNQVFGAHWFGRTVHIEGYPRSETKYPWLEVVDSAGKCQVIETTYLRRYDAEATHGDRIDPVDVVWYRELIERCIKAAEVHAAGRISRLQADEDKLCRWLGSGRRGNWDKLRADIPKAARNFVLGEELHRLDVWDDVPPDEYFEKFVEVLNKL